MTLLIKDFEFVEIPSDFGTGEAYKVIYNPKGVGMRLGIIQFARGLWITTPATSGVHHEMIDAAEALRKRLSRQRR